MGEGGSHPHRMLVLFSLFRLAFSHTLRSSCCDPSSSYIPLSSALVSSFSSLSPLHLFPSSHYRRPISCSLTPYPTLLSLLSPFTMLPLPLFPPLSLPRNPSPSLIPLPPSTPSTAWNDVSASSGSRLTLAGSAGAAGPPLPPSNKCLKIVIKLRRTRTFSSLTAAGLLEMAPLQSEKSAYKVLDVSPLFSQIETLLGSAVSLQFANNVFGRNGGSSTATLGTKSHVSNLMDQIQGINNLNFSLDSHPNMLHVQLQSVVDRHLHREVGEEVWVVSNRPALIAALGNFCSLREGQMWSDSPSVYPETEKFPNFQKLLDERTALAKRQEEEIAQLRALNAKLQDEKTSAEARLQAVENELQLMACERNTLQYLNTQLEVRTSEAESENDVLRSHLSSLQQAGAAAAEAIQESPLRREGEEEEGEEQEEKQELELAAKKQMALTRTMEVALESLETQRLKVLEVAGKLEGQLAEAVADMEERDTHINWLQNSLAELLRRKSQTERFVEEELRNEMEREDSERASSHAELEAVLEAERARYAEKAEKLERQLAAVHLEKNAALNHITELENALEQLDLQAEATQKSAEKMHGAIQVALSSPLRPLRSPSRHREQTGGETSYEGETDKLSMELHAYSRSIRNQYVDASLPVNEQEGGVDALVMELVARGASEGAARRYVIGSMARERHKVLQQDAEERLPKASSCK